MEQSVHRDQGKDIASDARTPPEPIPMMPTTVPDLQLDGKMASLAAGRAVRFCCHAPKARSVSLVGTFNQWDPQTTPLAKGEDGTWSTDLELEPGRYRYEFILDGQPSCEPGPDGTHLEVPDCVSNERGILNRVIEIT